MRALEIGNDCENSREKGEPHPYRRTMVVGTIAMIIIVMLIGSASLSAKTSSILKNNNNNNSNNDVLKNQALDNRHRRHLLDLADCDNCDGKISSLTLKYHGPGGYSILIVDKDDAELYSNPNLQIDAEFTFIGVDNKDTMGVEITLLYADGLECNIHTSCSVPIAIGLFFCDGDFEVLDGASRNGGPFLSPETCDYACSADCDAPLLDVRVTDPLWYGPNGNKIEEDVPTAEGCCQMCVDSNDCELYQHSVGLQTCVLFSAPLVSTLDAPLDKDFTVASC
jgi:hypothetical protein